MNGQAIMRDARERLAELVRGPYAEIPPEPPVQMSPWLAMSLFQKAIRRGRTDLAMRATATLLRDAPDRLWRRISIVAFEDIGVGDLGTIQLVITATAGKTARAKLGGDWAVASAIVARLTAAPKCRATDDLVMLVQHHPSLREARLELAALPTRDLIEIATGEASLPLRALATWFAIGTVRCTSDHLPRRRGEPDVVLDAFCDAGISNMAVETAREGLRRTGQILCPFVALLAPLSPHETADIVDDDLPPEGLIRGAPSWAFDMFVREGRYAMKVYLDGESETARWIREHAPASERIGLLGNILFAVEGGLLRSRLDWGTGSLVRRMAEHESQGARCPDGRPLIDLLRRDLPLLNEVRAHVA